MKTDRKKLLRCILIPLLTGGVSALLTVGAMRDFAALRQPPLSPPGWLFPAVWTVLYVMMGIASYYAGQAIAPAEARRTALTLYGVQLFFNFLWSVIFFSLKQYLLAFFWLLALWLLIYLTLHQFIKLHKKAGALLLPYLAWVTFAGYLNFGVFVLN